MRLLPIVALLALAARPALAQDPAGAEAAARAYSDAFAEGDWQAVAALTDPDDLARFSDFVGVIGEMAEDEPGMEELADADTPEAAFASFMGAVMSMMPEMAGMMQSIRTDILGHVPEGDSLVHVVTRSHVSMFGSEVSNVEVVTARWDGARWVVKLGEELDGMIAGMEAGLGGMDFGLDDDDDDEPRDPKKR